ncbi:beta-galactosidase [Actinoplanes sp. ATCC 53533]|uniref:beta-galactosidase n=1 Tax=Actinoplanes sp. ATCC 53533 TaxID=1288362 RepID=UPI000F79D3B0|nr:beta-galactosidase [Actinoplanes sp. ATCC 53533]RSM58074.1 beta-galactosidase [Actinoplanes sp. ATCC 53533]
MRQLMYGGDYNPEQWPADVHVEDAELMRRARVTTATVGVFAWSRLEPAPGRYDFGWLDKVLDRLAGHGVGAALATPTASPPPWFSLAHPEALPVNADGVRLSHGSRDTYCASAPAYRAAARRIAAALGEHYRDHPALAMWHVHNEYGTTCHCELTAEAFRGWLRRRYGDLDRLNDAWTTAFWGQHYTGWAQIRPPRRTQYLPNPAQVLDFRRFTSDELLAAYTEQRDVLRAATPGVPVTTNFVLGGWVPVDHARWAREVDLVAIDHYPSDPGPGAEEQAAFAADQARGWARQSPGGPGWLLMETAPNLIYAAGRMHTKEPGRMARQSLAAVARGSRGALFFQWRAPRGGAELFHSALVPHAGPDSRVYREAVALGEQLDRIGETAEGTVAARVAIGYDEPSAWALQAAGLPSDRLDHAEEAAGAHRALWRRGIMTDVIGALEGLSAYRMLILPGHYLMTDAQAAELRSWVEGGGRLVVTYLTGVADEYGRVRTGGYPGALRGLLGVRVEEFHPLGPDDRVALAPAAAASAVPAGLPAVTGELWSETVHLAGAQPVLRYAGGVLDGRPAVTRHPVGDGVAYYVSTRLDPDSYGDLLTTVAASAGAVPELAGLPPGVEAVRRRAGDRSWLFLLNHTGDGCEVPADGVDLLTGAAVSGTVRVPPGGAAVIRES